MALSNQERVGKAMELLRAGLAPFVEREFKSLHQGDAAATVTCLGSSDQRFLEDGWFTVRS